MAVPIFGLNPISKFLRFGYFFLIEIKTKTFMVSVLAHLNSRWYLTKLEQVIGTQSVDSDV